MTMEQEIQRQVKEVDAKVNGVDIKVHTVDNKVDKILMVLTGNPMDKDDNGFIGKVNSHDDRIEKIEKKIDIFSAKALGVGIGVLIMAGVGFREILAIIFKF